MSDPAGPAPARSGAIEHDSQGVVRWFLRRLRAIPVGPPVGFRGDGALAAGRRHRRAGARSATRPSRPTTRSALQSALTTASSVASTVAAKNGSSSPSASVSAPRAVEKAMKISPLPWCATDPVRASPRPARRATRSSCSARSGASVGDDDDAAAGGARAPAAPAVRHPAGARPERRRCAGRVASRSSSARARRPSRRPTTRLDVPIPPLKSKHVMPVAGADRALGDAVARGVGQRAARVGGLDLHRARLAEPAVVALRDDRDHDVIDAHAPGRPRPRRPRRRRRRARRAIVAVR